MAPVLLEDEACGTKVALAKDIPVAESGAEASLKEVPKKDLTAFDSAKAVSAAHEPSAFADWTTPSNPRRNNGREGEAKESPEKKLATAGIDEWKTGCKGEPNLVDCSKSTTPIDPPTAPSGVTKEDPALEPAAAGDAPLPSMKEFPAARTLDAFCAGDADRTVSAKESPGVKPATAPIASHASVHAQSLNYSTHPPLARAQGISGWTNPSKLRRKKARKGSSARVGRVESVFWVGGKNRFGALLGTNGNEDVGGGGKVAHKARPPRGSTPPTTDSGMVETATVPTLDSSVSASGRFSWPKLCPSYNLLRLFASLALICLGAAFAHSSYSATAAPLATVAKPFTPASPNGFCEVGGIDTSSFVAIVSSESVPADHPGGRDEGRSWEALMDEIGEAVGEPLHLIGEPLASVKEIYEKQPAEADLETAPASRNSMERKGEPEIDLVGPVYSNRTGIIARGRDTVLPVNDTSPELRPADAGKPGMLEVRKLVETGLGAPVASMHAGGEWRANDRLTDASRVPTKDLFLQRCRAIEPLLAATLEEPAWPAEVRAAQSSDSNAVESDIFSVSSVCADWQPHCAAPAWHVEPRHALTDELNKTDKPPADPPADVRSIELPSPFHFPSTSGTSSSAPGRARQRGQLLAALFLLLGACWCGVLLSAATSQANVAIYLPSRADFKLGSQIICDVEIIDSTVRDCSAKYRGGVVYAQPYYAVSSGAVSIIGSNLTSCSAGWRGGVVYARESGAVSISGSNVSSCSAGWEGGVVYASDRSGAVSIIGSNVSGCSAGEFGGVVSALNSISLSIAGIAFIDNRADRSGSVLYLSNTPSSISDASFTGNTAGDDKTIQTDKPIDWDCRLGSWMPTEGAFKGDFSVGLQPKFKIVVSFYQVSSILGLVYGVRLDEHFTRWLDVLKLFSLDLFDVAIPGRCIGAMSTRLLVAGLWPYGAVTFVSLAIVAVAAVLNVKQRQAFDRQLLGRLLYWAILIFYLVLPSVSRSIFSARLCESFGYDDATGQRISYLLANPSLTCDAGPAWDDETSGLAPYFWAFFALWPVLVPLGFLALLLRVRKPVAAQRATPLSRATSFLWRDYSAGFLFWEVLDLVRKIFLTSMVLFIDQEYGSRKLLRTVVAGIVSAMFLTLLALARPYRRSDDLCLACIANLLLTCCFASGVVIQLCDSTAYEDMCYDLVGYKTSRGATTFVVVLTAVMLAVSLAVILVSAVSASRAKTMRLVSSKREPMRDGITLADGQEWHLFLSHVWSTGQDAVAVIKNELLQFLPGCEIFLDVDDLKNIGELEAYIGRSQVVLCFLSRGYLRSTNCLREIRAALEMGKPLVLVHEADPAKGGGTLAELRSECPEELRAAIFDAGWPMTVWHRIEAFQHISLKVIAEALLLKTPKYAGENELPLCIPGEVRAVDLAFPKPVVLWASTLNAGARDLADAVAAAVAGGISVTDAIPSRLSSLPRSSDSDGDEATHMLLYLNRSTWAGEGAEALAEQVRAAREARLPIVMAHENDVERAGCIFGHFFEVTPRDLIADGLYNDLAVGCHADPHRQVSLALLAQALGATKRTAQSRVLRATLARMTQTRGSSNGDDLVV
ncbi:hypothetical protein EMIHUDRAFT_215127 [Emiliania huxleyi CCMP1516]|uniref:TIR domain-containing protein n=2 Tax=Emiliania huxleyi TaxID=2903 RepID=A0A0D3IHY9_EMIH1|nr:hypothetical protein EMIHUDRAFT_215127 [Emiliania huxleyi CCMP1516]EOD10874.1 hypothetical protein EMIHUDRAFT_215127 [Emiliania huxleyi CCMP1516]|eukprot:XP_005763303.1 hypothetical protein EMIHUDRAFT_215127 [Emiliania huxleyi CCMP1516]